MYRPITAALVAVAGIAIPATALAQDYSQIRNMTRPGQTIIGSGGKVIGTIESVGSRTFVMTTPDGSVTMSKGVLTLGVTGLRVDKTEDQVRRMITDQASQSPG